MPISSSTANAEGREPDPGVLYNQTDIVKRKKDALRTREKEGKLVLEYVDPEQVLPGEIEPERKKSVMR